MGGSNRGSVSSMVRVVAAMFVIGVLVAVSGGSASAVPAFRSDASVAVRWFSLLHDLIRDEKLPPTIASRAIGYAGVTLYESVVQGMPGHRSLGGQLNELSALPVTKPGKNIHWPTAANAAMAVVMRSLFATAAPGSLAKIDALELELAALYVPGLRPGNKLFTLSAAHGKAVGQAIIAWKAGDGFAAASTCPFTPPVGDGLWVPTPPAFKPALHPCWGDLRTFVLTSGSECAPPPPPAYSIDPASAFYQEGREVYDTGVNLTDEQRDIALFWSDDPALTGTPPGHWVSIVSQLATRDAWSLDRAAEAYARVGLGVADAFIACWDAKFQHNLLRPVTYIQSEIDPNWLPLLGTPPFAEYTSGHSTQSGAVAALLTAQLGVVAFTDHTHDARGLQSRSFHSFSEAADEAAISRMYGGIHYRAAIEQGLEQGRCIAGAIHDRVKFLEEDDD